MDMAVVDNSLSDMRAHALKLESEVKSHRRTGFSHTLNPDCHLCTWACAVRG